MILTIRTDMQQAEVGLYVGSERKDYKVWQAHRELSRTIHVKIEEILKDQGKNWHDLEGVVFYKGPGSFTGLRIGSAVASTLISALKIPGAAVNGENWISDGIEKIKTNPDKVLVPEYGSEPYITKPVK